MQLSSQSLCFTGKKTVLEVQCYPWFLCTWLYLSSVWLTWIHYQLKNNNDAVFFVIHAFVLLLHKYEIWLHQSCKHNNPPPSFQSTTNPTPHKTEFVAFRSGLKGWHTLQRMAIHSSLFSFKSADWSDDCSSFINYCLFYEKLEKKLIVNYKSHLAALFCLETWLKFRFCVSKWCV